MIGVLLFRSSRRSRNDDSSSSGSSDLTVRMASPPVDYSNPQASLVVDGQPANHPRNANHHINAQQRNVFSTAAAAFFPDLCCVGGSGAAHCQLHRLPYSGFQCYPPAAAAAQYVPTTAGWIPMQPPSIYFQTPLTPVFVHQTAEDLLQNGRTTGNHHHHQNHSSVGHHHHHHASSMNHTVRKIFIQISMH